MRMLDSTDLVWPTRSAPVAKGRRITAPTPLAPTAVHTGGGQGHRTRLMTSREVAAALGVHVNTVKRAGDRGDLRFYRVSRRGDRRYDPADIVAYLKEMSR